MAREAETQTSFTQVVEIDRRVEHIYRQGRGATPNKRPRQFGRFSGASSGSKVILVEIMLSG